MKETWCMLRTNNEHFTWLGRFSQGNFTLIANYKDFLKERMKGIVQYENQKTQYINITKCYKT